MQGASVKQTRSVCSERARTPVGGRSRCVFAKQIRGFSAQAISPIWMRCRLSSGCPCPASTPAPNRGESNSVQGAGVKKTPHQRRVRRAFPNGSPGGKHVPEFTLRLGRSFRMTHQAEAASQNIGSEWDAFSGWVVGGKFIPESALRTGRAFPMAVQAEAASRNSATNWDTLSASPAASKNPCARHPKTG